MDIEIITTYRCPVCERMYADEAAARACVASKPESDIKPGDFVTAGGHRFGWFDGDPAWILSSKEGRSATGKLHEFIYVVGHVELYADTWDSRPGHRLRYHLFTRAMSGESGYSEGWTAFVSHLTPRKVTPLQDLGDVSEFIGRMTHRLL